VATARHEAKKITREIVDDGKILLVRIPITFKKRGGRKEIVVPEAAREYDSPKTPEQQTLMTNVARAHQWAEALSNGTVGSVSDLAKRLNLDLSYVNRMLRLAFLAPDIVEAILRGQEPSGLSVRRLCKYIPESWAEQRALFGVEDKP
jgi:hypothetical protein